MCLKNESVSHLVMHNSLRPHGYSPPGSSLSHPVIPGWASLWKQWQFLHNWIHCPPMRTSTESISVVKMLIFHIDYFKNCKVKSFIRFRLFATPWTLAHQAPPSMGFSRQEYWSGLPFPSRWIINTIELHSGSVVPACIQTIFPLHLFSWTYNQVTKE